MELTTYIIIGLSALLLVATYYSIKFGMIVLRMQEAIEDCIEKLDDSYASISQTLQTPLFFDNSEVKKVLADIDQSRNAVLYVAGQLASIEETEEFENEEE